MATQARLALDQYMLTTHAKCTAALSQLRCQLPQQICRHAQRYRSEFSMQRHQGAPAPKVASNCLAGDDGGGLKSNFDQHLLWKCLLCYGHPWSLDYMTSSPGAPAAAADLPEPRLAGQ